MLERLPHMRSGRLIDLANQRGHNDNFSQAHRPAGGGTTTDSRSLTEAGLTGELAVPTEDDVNLMILIAEISASAEEAEAAADSGAKRICRTMVDFVAATAVVIGIAILLL